MEAKPESAPPPDIETSSDGYATRFSGRAGDYLLSVQRQAILEALGGARCGTALDVGGGHAQLAPILVDLGLHTTVLGSRPGCHDRVRRAFPDGPVSQVTGELLELPFPDRSFDLVTAVRLISHVDRWDSLLAELCRVARNYVLFDYPAVRSLNVLTPFLFNFKKQIEGNTRSYLSFRRAQLKRVLAQNQFGVAREAPQFLLPMVVHRAARGARLLQHVEYGFKAVGFTRLLGSPVILRADRLPAE